MRSKTFSYSMDTVDTVRKEKSFPGSQRWKGKKIGRNSIRFWGKKRFFLDFLFKWPLEYSSQLTHHLSYLVGQKALR